MTKTISEQLREYFKMVPPTAKKIADVRKRWRQKRHSEVALDIALDTHKSDYIFVEPAKNDNKARDKK